VLILVNFTGTVTGKFLAVAMTLACSTLQGKPAAGNTTGRTNTWTLNTVSSQDDVT
jgi:hypothetical protein